MRAGFLLSGVGRALCCGALGVEGMRGVGGLMILFFVAGAVVAGEVELGREISGEQTCAKLGARQPGWLLSLCRGLACGIDCLDRSSLARRRKKGRNRVTPVHLLLCWRFAGT